MPRTPQCTSGSSAQSGAPAFITLGIFGPTLTWWQAIAQWITTALLGLPDAPIDTAAFCAAEPLGDLPTTADYIALAFPPIALATGAYGRFGNQVRADAFSAYCQCNAPSSSSCEAIWQSMSPTGFGNNTNAWGIAFAPQSSAYCWGARMYLGPSGGMRYELRIWDPSQTTIMTYIQFTGISGVQDVLFASPVLMTALSSYTIEVCCLGPGGNDYKGVGANVSNVHTDALVHYGTYVEAPNNTVYPSTVRTYQAPLQPWVCPSGSSPPIPFIPPAPPPPIPPTGFTTTPACPTCGSYQDVCNYLCSIEKEIDGIARLLLEMQPRIGATSLAESTVHSGLTGSGTLAVSGILGVKVSFSAPPGYGITPGDPTTTWSAARVSTITAEGVETNTWIGSSPELLRTPYDTTHIGYYFGPGVTGTITELVQGP